MNSTLVRAILIFGGAYVLYQNWRQINLANLNDNSALFFNPVLYKQARAQHSDPITHLQNFDQSEFQLRDPELGVSKFAETVPYRDTRNAPYHF